MSRNARLRLGLLAFTLLGLMTAPAAWATCGISVGVQNMNEQTIRVHVTLFSAVKSKGGSWRGIDKGYWGPHDVTYAGITLSPGQTYKDTYSAAFGCGKDRRYRIRYECGGDSSITQYYPSATGWTNKTQFVMPLNGC